MKKVSYREYNKALRDLQERFGRQVMVMDMGSTLDRREIEMGVNWAAIGAVKPEEAEAFAELLTKAAKAAREFPYNGYEIDWSKED